MIIGMHALLYSKNAEVARSFLGELGLRSVDAGDGWLIFALPPAEMAVHPTDDEHGGALLHVRRHRAHSHGARVAWRGGHATDRRSGLGHLTTLRIPGGGEIGLYEPR